ncbi:DoxX family protein [Pelagibacteraceae bacterium]|jgi:putative oxidoreductase|nr:DoxX family protein [Pelagibacteraceae bacterium]|tara:strand:+ start:150 stop:536 length:387 start_codon:yes stop_codon:yes gene_type:complete
MISLIDLFARILISVIFLFSGINKILQYDDTALWMGDFGIPEFLLIPVITIEILFSIFIICGYRVKLAAVTLALFCLATGFIFHLDFSNSVQTINLMKNLGLAGGLFFLAINGPKNFVLFKKKKYVKL